MNILEYNKGEHFHNTVGKILLKQDLRDNNDVEKIINLTTINLRNSDNQEILKEWK